MASGLEIDALDGGYGRGASVVHRVNLTVPEGGIVAVLGPNGAGKTTLLKLVTGLATQTGGAIRWNGEGLKSRGGVAQAHRGFALVPQGHHLFKSLSIVENLRMGGRRLRRDKREENIHRLSELFPIIRERPHQLAASLSGGERAMIAVARGLMADPDLLILDEPSSGLAPIYRQRIFKALSEIAVSQRLTVLLAEQDVGNALRFAQHASILQGGQVVLAAPTKDLSPQIVKDAFFGHLMGGDYK